MKLQAENQAGADGSDKTQPECESEYRRDCGYRHLELIRDRRHEKQENREVEGIEHPTEPGGNPSKPLILGGLFPPRNG